MELIERLSTAALLVLATVVLGAVVFKLIVDVVRGTDLVEFEAMRTANPSQFRKIVFVCRWNGAMVVGLGAMMTIVGFSTILSGLVTEPVDLLTALTGLGMSLLGVGVMWFAFRWCRWAWRTKLN